MAAGFLREGEEPPLAPAKLIAARSVCDPYRLGTPSE